MDDKENIALYNELCTFLKKENSEWKSLILGENEVNWAYRLTEVNGMEYQKLLPSKYHPIFYAVRKNKAVLASKIEDRITVPDDDDDSEFQEA